MTGDWALFGEKRKGHDLVRQWGSSNVQWKKMTSRTDVPQGLSGVVFSQPILAGYPELEGYVFSWMASHPEAPRAGMVLTLAQHFHVNGDAAMLSERLSTFLSLGSLPHEVWLDLHAGVVQLEEVLASQPAGPVLEVTRHTHSLLHALLGTSKTAVWVPETGFAEAIASLWLHLPPELRGGVRFRYSQGPNDLGMREQQTVVYAPIASVQKWGTQFTRVGFEPQASRLAAQMLLGKDAQDFQSYMGFFQQRPKKLHELGRFEKLFEVWQNIATGNLQLLPQYIQGLKQYPLHEIQGQNHRSQLSRFLSQFMAQADLRGIQGLANLDLSGLTPDPDPFTSTLSTRASWLMKQVTVQPSEPLIELLLRSDTQEWWRHALVPEFLQHMHAQDPAFAATIWKWLENPTLFPLITPFITADSEERLSKQIPVSITPELQERLGQVALAQEWPHLAAFHLARKKTLPEAALEFQRCFSKADQLQLLLQQYAVPQVAQWISESPDPPSLAAARYAAHHPEVFNFFDLQHTNWRKLWLNAVEQGMDVFKPGLKVASVSQGIM